MPDPVTEVDENTESCFHLIEIAVPGAVCDTQFCHDKDVASFLKMLSMHAIS